MKTVYVKFTADARDMQLHPEDAKRTFLEGFTIRIKDVRCRCRCEHCWQKVLINAIRDMGNGKLLLFVERM